MNWFFAVIKKYADFSGRARRSEYWYYTLFAVLICCGLAIIDGLTGTFDRELGAGLLSGLFYLGILVPSIAVGVRRLHDTDRSGWWWLLALIPFVGGLVLLVFCAQNGHVGDNRFGPDPKRAD